MNNKEIYEDYWSKPVDDYKWCSAGNIWYNNRMKKLINRYIQKDEVLSLLDAGCGDGSKTYLFSKIFKNAEVKGIDFTNAAIEHAKSLYASNNLSYAVGDVSEIKEKFDCIACLEVLEHIDDWKSIVDSFVECSPKYLIISSPTGRMRECEKFVGHVRNFKKGEIESYIEEKHTPRGGGIRP